MTARIDIDYEKIAAFCRKWKVREFALFGSVLRDDFGPDSDVDVLVEFEPGQVPGLAFFDMEEELAQLFGRKVDVVTKSELRNPFRRHEILTTKQQFLPAEDERGGSVATARRLEHTPDRGAPARPGARDVGHLWDLREEAEAAREITDDETYDSYARNEMLQYATQRVVGVAARAAERVSRRFRKAHPEIPWADLTAARRLLKDYRHVDRERVWDLASRILPGLIPKLKALIPPPPPDPEPER